MKSVIALAVSLGLLTISPSVGALPAPVEHKKDPQGYGYYAEYYSGYSPAEEGADVEEKRNALPAPVEHKKDPQGYGYYAGYYSGYSPAEEGADVEEKREAHGSAVEDSEK